MQTYSTPRGELIIDTDAIRVSVDLTGGWKSALLLYLVARDISENNIDTKIIPCISRRVNVVGEPDYYRPDAVPIVEKQIAWIKETFPDVEFDETFKMDVDFWWLTIQDGKCSLDVAEKTLLRHAYQIVLNLFDHEKLEPNDRTRVRGYNAYCSDPNSPRFTIWENPYKRVKPYEHGVESSEGIGTSVSLVNGEVFSLRPFANSDKLDLAQIAKDLGILDKLDEVSYTCEQSTTEIKEPCMDCCNCWQLYKRAKIGIV